MSSEVLFPRTPSRTIGQLFICKCQRAAITVATGKHKAVPSDGSLPDRSQSHAAAPPAHRVVDASRRRRLFPTIPPATDVTNNHRRSPPSSERASFSAPLHAPSSFCQLRVARQKKCSGVKRSSKCRRSVSSCNDATA